MNAPAETLRTHAAPVYRIDDLTIDLGQQRVMRGDTEVPLPVLSFDLLVALVRAAPNLLTFDQLMEQVWAGVIVAPETITQRVKLVRDALDDDPHHPHYIGGVRGRGYRILPPVEALPGAMEVPSDAAGSPAIAPLDQPTHLTALVRRRWPAGVAIGTTLLVAAAAVLFSWRERETNEQRSSVVVERPRTIAVLPFVNLSGGKENDYFSDGLTEELINRVARIPELRVTALTSAFAFKGRQQDIRAIGTALDVGTILEGSVRRSGDRVRVSVQLVNARNGYDLWSDTYERKTEDIFAIHDEIASRIAQVIGIRVAAETTQKPTKNAVAYELYLRARAALAQRVGEADVRQAITLYEQAIALDPGFARAQAALASALWVLPAYADVSEAETQKRASALARSALASDPTISDAYLALAHSSAYLNDLVAAEDAYLAALKRGPNDSDAHQSYGSFLLDMGRVRQSLRELSEAQRLDPASPAANVSLSLAYIYSGNADEAEHYAIIATQLGRKNLHMFFGDIAVMRRQFDQALSEFRAIELDPGVPPFADEFVALLRDPSRPPAELARAWTRYCEEAKVNGYCYWRLVLVGEYAAAFAVAHRQWRMELWYPALLWYPFLASARSQPGFNALVRDIGLVDDWRKYGWADACKPIGEDFRCE